MRLYLTISCFFALPCFSVSERDICKGFRYLKRCQNALETKGSSKDGSASMYCSVACFEENSFMYNEICHCNHQPDTTTVPPPEEVCYYSTNRPARLGATTDESHRRQKRIFQGTPAENCQYPGVVGLFFNAGTRSQMLICAGVLLDEKTILISGECKNYVDAAKASDRYHINALVGSYKTSTLSKNSPLVDKNSDKPLDSGGLTDLYTIKLQSPLKFDDKCIQPACVPNSHMTVDDIDLQDCRIVGYGSTDYHNRGPLVKSLMETRVLVDEASVKKDELEYARLFDRMDGPRLGPCLFDFGAPLICSHKTTQEWIVIGITNLISLPCSSATLSNTTVKNLLKEASFHAYYNSLQKFKYSERISTD